MTANGPRQQVGSERDGARNRPFLAFPGRRGRRPLRSPRAPFLCFSSLQSPGGCLLAALVAASTGCEGSATIQFVSLHLTEIDPPSTAVVRYDAQEAYWWLDDEGQFNLAFRCVRHNPWVGKLGRVEVLMSLVPGPPPAGRGRVYTIRHRETRTILRGAADFQRCFSFNGVMDALFDDPRHVRGNFRIWMRPNEQLYLFSFVPRTTGPLLCFGEYRAIHDPRKGRAIRELCEKEGGRRPPLPAGAKRRQSASAPAATPSGPPKGR